MLLSPETLQKHPAHFEFQKLIHEKDYPCVAARIAYGEEWESIQFSGRNNPADWKCPYHVSKNI